MGDDDLIRSRVKLRHLALAAAVHRYGSIRRAAGSLKVTQPAATRALKELEHYLGTRLFDRSRTGVTPTLYGERFVARAHRILRDVETSAAEIRDLKEGHAGQIKVGVGPTGATSIFPKAVRRLWAESPSVKIAAIQAPYARLVPDLLAGDLDIVISRLVDASNQPGLVQEALYQDPIAIVCAPDHPLLRRKALELRDLVDQDWILPYGATQFRDNLSDAFCVAGLQAPKPKLESGSIMVTRSFLQHTQMIAGMPLLAARTEEEMGALGILPVRINTKVTPVGVTTRADSVHMPAMLAFMDHLRAVARDYDQWIGNTRFGHAA